MSFLEKSRKSYNKIATNYDNSFEGHYVKKGQKILLTAIKNHLKLESSTILDLVCGNGFFLYELSQISSKINLHGIDISENMVACAQKKCPSSNIIIGDTAQLPYKDQSINIIIASFTFHHFPDPLKVLKEVKRVLKKEGCLFILDPWFPFPVRSFMNIIIPFSSKGDVHLYSSKEINILAKNAQLKISYSKIIKFHSSLFKIINN